MKQLRKLQPLCTARHKPARTHLTLHACWWCGQLQLLEAHLTASTVHHGIITTGVGVAQWHKHSPLTNATRVRFPAWVVGELGLRSLSDVGGFLRVLRFPLPTKSANYANICAISELALLFET